MSSHEYLTSNIQLLETLDAETDLSELTNNPQVDCPPEGDPRLKLTSYSSGLLLNGCLRKYQLTKLGSNGRANDHMTQLTYDFGHAVGEAVVDLLCGQTKEQVLWKLFCSWPNHIFFENEKQKKSLWHVVYAIEQFLLAREAGLLEDYELVYLDSGKPAAEVSFKIIFPNGFIERGYIDMILRHKYSGKYCIFDNKTSSARYLNSDQYTNSMQALGYSVVLNKIDPGQVEVDYTVFYLVWMTFLERWEQFEFPKSEVHRAQWIQKKLWDMGTLERLLEVEGSYGMWPISGENCTSFGKPCKFLHECHRQTETLIAPLRQSDMNDEPLDRYGKPWDIVIYAEELLRESDG